MGIHDQLPPGRGAVKTGRLGRAANSSGLPGLRLGRASQPAVTDNLWILRSVPVPLCTGVCSHGHSCPPPVTWPSVSLLAGLPRGFISSFRSAGSAGLLGTHWVTSGSSHSVPAVEPSPFPRSRQPNFFSESWQLLRVISSKETPFPNQTSVGNPKLDITVNIFSCKHSFDHPHLVLSSYIISWLVICEPICAKMAKSQLRAGQACVLSVGARRWWVLMTFITLWK